MNTSNFEEILRTIDTGPWKTSVMEVSDVAFLMWRWFENYCPEKKCTAADIVALTAIVMARVQQREQVERIEEDRQLGL